MNVFAPKNRSASGSAALNPAAASRGRNGPKREHLDEFGIATLDGPASASQQNSLMIVPSELC